MPASGLPKKHNLKTLRAADVCLICQYTGVLLSFWLKQLNRLRWADKKNFDTYVRLRVIENHLKIIASNLVICRRVLQDAELIVLRRRSSIMQRRTLPKPLFRQWISVGLRKLSSPERVRYLEKTLHLLARVTELQAQVARYLRLSPAEFYRREQDLIHLTDKQHRSYLTDMQERAFTVDKLFRKRYPRRGV